MKPLSSSLSKTFETLQARSAERTDFPSLEHKIAWEIAVEFREPYGFWVRQVKSTWLLAGQVEHEFKVLQAKTGYTTRQRAKMLMAVMFPKTPSQTPPRGL